MPPLSWPLFLLFTAAAFASAAPPFETASFASAPAPFVNATATLRHARSVRPRPPVSSTRLSSRAMAAQLNVDSRLPLEGGGAIPVMGYGTYATGSTKKEVLSALRQGVRHIDTAAFYNNEADVGKAIRESGVPREEIFVTTKLWYSDHGYDEALAAFDRSMKLLGLDYVDLYLVHWPLTRHGDSSPLNAAVRAESWRALEKIRAQGRAKAIGVSNYTEKHLAELLASCKVRPAVNQVELHPRFFSQPLLRYCRRERIVVVGHSPMAQGTLFKNPVVNEVAARAGKSPAQVLLRWQLQKGAAVIPKSSRPERVAQNADIFDWELPAADMGALDSLRDNFCCTMDPYQIK